METDISNLFQRAAWMTVSEETTRSSKVLTSSNIAGLPWYQLPHYYFYIFS